MAATIRAGQRFGRLVVVIPRGRVTNKKGKQRKGYSPLCLCDCGNWSSPEFTALRHGITLSCGCLKAENTSARARTHGLSRSQEYQIWRGARGRCQNPNNTNYPRYGGQGVTFSPAFDDFEVFLAEIGPRPSPQHTLDRIKNDRGYEPGNIRWATRPEQLRNKRNNVRLFLNGELMTLIDAINLLGLNETTVRNRRHRGWPPERWFEPHQVTVTLCD